MAINIVVVDAARLPAGVEFPPLEAARYGWEQYLSLEGEALRERCWRANVLVVLDTAIGAPELAAMPRLELLVAAGGAGAGLDRAVAEARGVRVQTMADADLGDPAAAQALCGRIVAAIDAFIAGR